MDCRNVCSIRFRFTYTIANRTTTPNKLPPMMAPYVIILFDDAELPPIFLSIIESCFGETVSVNLLLNTEMDDETGFSSILCIW